MIVRANNIENDRQKKVILTQYAFPRLESKKENRVNKKFITPKSEINTINYPKQIFSVIEKL